MLDNSKFLDKVLDVLPHKPYCADDLFYGIRPRPRETALKRRYLQVNPPAHAHYLLFDVDRDQAALAWEYSDLAPPNFVTVNKKNGHGHYLYKLETPVVTSDQGRSKPLKYLAAVELGYRSELRADSGYSGLITRNPYVNNKDQHVICNHTHAYDLSELAEYLPLDLKEYKEKEIQVAGFGRNSMLFENVRVWAYSAIRLYRAERRQRLRSAWESEVLSYAERINAEFASPLPFSEIKATAKSIAKYCWSEDPAAEQKFIEKQSERGKASGLVRAANAEQKRVQAKLLAAQGLSQRAIAQELSMSVGSINRYLKE